MSVRLPISIAEKLLAMHNGARLPFSQLKHVIVETMLENGVLNKQNKGRSKAFIYIPDDQLLNTYLKNHFGIDSLINYISGYKKDNLTRAEAIVISSTSKLKVIRTFEGFLLNCYEPIQCTLNNLAFTVSPTTGCFTFIFDYKNFIPDSNITIIGIENPENFRYINRQKQLFKDIKPLFVSRYPQNKDLLRWLQSIPNPYLHFGDFDFAGLNIYFNEYKKHLRDRAQFFIPPEIEQLISTKGNRDLYNNQQIQFSEENITEHNILNLLSHIRKYKKGLEQEIFLK